MNSRYFENNALHQLTAWIRKAENVALEQLISFTAPDVRHFHVFFGTEIDFEFNLGFKCDI
jgi:hypothetical protein